MYCTSLSSILTRLFGGSSIFPSFSILVLLELGMLEVEGGLDLSVCNRSSKDLRDGKALGLLTECMSVALSVLLNSLVSVISPERK